MTIAVHQPRSRWTTLRLPTLFGAVVLLTAAGTAGAQTPDRQTASARPATSASGSTAPLHVATAPAAHDSAAVTEESIDAGRRIFHGTGTCFACHGPSLEGGPVAPTLRDHPWRDAKGGSLDAIYYVVTHGVPGTMMVSHPGGISDADARRVASYIWAVSHGHAHP